MKKADQNSGILVGSVAYAKAWPPKGGRTFTNGMVKLIPESGGDAITVKFTLNVDNKNNELDKFEKLFTTGREIVIAEAKLGGYSKDNTWVPEIEGKLSCVAVGPGNKNDFTVSGRVVQVGGSKLGGRGYVVESTYKGKKDWKTKTAWVHVRKELVDTSGISASIGDRVLVTGKVKQEDKRVFLEADFISQIQG